jgi:pimeloyl-ACP methyl ester carboxylesterase
MIARLPDGTELWYEESGSGLPVVFLHGWPHDHTAWTAQLSGLATHARCIAPDLRGFGRSTVAGPWSMDRYADDVVALLDALAIDRAVICGLSMGGYVALAIWRRHPERVRALVLVDTRATADDQEGREKRRRLIRFVESQGIDALADQQLGLMLGPATLATRPELSEALRRMMASQPAEGVTGALRAMMERPDSTGLVAGITVPTLVVGGTEDAIIPGDVLRRLAAAIPGARLEMIDGAGHLPQFERPGTFNHALGDFLESLLER